MSTPGPPAGSIPIGAAHTSRPPPRQASAEAVEDELLAVFRDDMLQVRPVPAEQDESHMSVTGPEIESAVFRAPGPVIADRLDAMGIDAARVQADLDRTLKGAAEPATEADLGEYGDEARASVRAEEELLSAMSAQDWAASLAATPDDPDAVYNKSLGSRGWLVNLLDSEDGWDTLRRLRAILLAYAPEVHIPTRHTDRTLNIFLLARLQYRPGAGAD